MTAEIWVLGATGRTGRDVASRLAAADRDVVLVGRDAERLRAASPGAGPRVRTVVAPTPEAMAQEIRRQEPSVVVNTVGPFARTAGLLASAGLPTSSYLDLANDFVSAEAVLSLHEQALAGGRTLVTGAGFGVLAVEALVLALCRGKAVPARIRVDAVPSLALEAGAIGEALAATVLEGVPVGGRRFVGGRLRRDRVGAHPLRLTTPDGDVVTTVGWPSGDLVVARRVSGAADVTAATSELPSGAAVRLGLPVAGALLSIAPIRRLAVRRFARVSFAARAAPRASSWTHAVAEWPDGSSAEGWLRVGDAGAFTAAAASAVAGRIADGRAVAGAWSPAAAVGEDVLAEAGGELLTD